MAGFHTWHNRACFCLVLNLVSTSVMRALKSLIFVDSYISHGARTVFQLPQWCFDQLAVVYKRRKIERKSTYDILQCPEQFRSIPNIYYFIAVITTSVSKRLPWAVKLTQRSSTVPHTTVNWVRSWARTWVVIGWSESDSKGSSLCFPVSSRRKNELSRQNLCRGAYYSWASLARDTGKPLLT